MLLRNISKTLSATAKNQPMLSYRIFSRHNHNLDKVDKGERKDVSIPEPEANVPIKFTESKANVGYQATLHWYGDTRDLPPSHNYFLYVSFMAPVLYGIWLRPEDPEDNDREWFLRPIQDKYPELQIPLLQNAIRHNRKIGHSTKALEEKLDIVLQQLEAKGKLGNLPKTRLKEI